jgi:ATP-dependent Clp protease ATP-binding subunit ClpB
MQFRPEYINRLDDIIIFHSLDQGDIHEIVKLQLDQLKRRVLASAGLDLSFSDTLIDHVSAEGFDPTYGARPIKRLIQREIENGLAREVLENNLIGKVSVDFDGKKVVFK